jgi:hypothetical protein
MPIGPEHRLDKPQPTLARQFTDREQFIDIFEGAISELPPTEYEVLVYYGVGGIGKTSLRIELCPPIFSMWLKGLAEANREPGALEEGGSS